MTDPTVLKADQDFAATLLALADDETRDRLIHMIAEQVAVPILEKKAHLAGYSLDFNEDSDGRLEAAPLVESFVAELQPSHDVYQHIHDEWHFIWEYAWTDGRAKVVLGSAAGDEAAAENLMMWVDELATRSSYAIRPDFPVRSYSDFIKEWRAKFVAELSRLSEIDETLQLVPS